MNNDDGLLLNFASPDVDTGAKSTKKQTKVTGGRWKDRRKLQLSMQGRGRHQNKARFASGVNSGELKNPRMVENANVGDDGGDSKQKNGVRRSVTIAGDPTKKRVKFSEQSGEFGGKDGTYVSSLFTSQDGSSTLVPTAESEVGISHSPSNAPLKDDSSFRGLGINEKLNHHLMENLRLKTPTKIQRTVIPDLLVAESDIFVKAQTGSGKTLAYLLPIFSQLMLTGNSLKRDIGLFAIILAPTRELANQIYGVIESLSRCYHHLVPGIVIGGEKKKSEKARIRKGVNILVATPGRLVDHMENTTSLDVRNVRWLVLDEGDKLMELGFEETITKITEKLSNESGLHTTTRMWPSLPKRRVNVLCSATIQPGVQKLGDIVLKNSKMISSDNTESIGSYGDSNIDDFDSEVTTGNKDTRLMTVPDQLIQNILVVPAKLRLVTLNALLKAATDSSVSSKTNQRTIVFFSCSDSVDFHFDLFSRTGCKLKRTKNTETGEYNIIEGEVSQQDDDEEPSHSILTAPLLGSGTVLFKLHGSLSQIQRTSTLQSFAKSTYSSGDTSHSILFCTDVASRGLDLPNITNVVEYDPPFTIEDHLHRIGRSARVGKEGSATLFLLPGIEEDYVKEKLNHIHDKAGSMKILNYETVLKKGFADTQILRSRDNQSKVDVKRKEGKWDIHATTWHMEVERWLLENSAYHERASQAFTSHIRAYATHLSSERKYFNVKLLHLGHLAKSFGLRETPKKLGKSGAKHRDTPGGEKVPTKEDPRKKMLRLAKLAVSSTNSEFNY